MYIFCENILYSSYIQISALFISKNHSYKAFPIKSKDYMNSRFRNNINNQEIIVVIHKMSQTSKISKETIFRHKLDNIKFLNI